MAIKKNGKKYAYSKAVHMVLDATMNVLAQRCPRWQNPYLMQVRRENNQHYGHKWPDGHDTMLIRKHVQANAMVLFVPPSGLSQILPYVLLSYTHRLSDVFTLAHEIGHAVPFHCSIR